ncbi:energy transducer TonB [Tenacibaculum sp. 190524A02b]|uniref:energy transducer TonB n=1 Tax=Tenacibaculum vairaonense TaxID=3137860 RepID=UPI0031FA6BC4
MTHLQKFPLSLLTFFLAFNIKAFCQQTCTTPSNEVTDLNSITINKCDVGLNKNNTPKQRTIIRTSNNVSRKRVTNRIKTSPNRVNSNLGINNDLKKTITNSNNTSFKNKLKSKEVLFDLVDESPLFPNCKKNNTIIENKRCFKENIQKHFAKNFNPETIAEDEISGKILIKFTITINGSIENISTISKKKSNLLEKEIIKILSKTPNLTPGKVNDVPVNVTYVLPINLTLE